MTTEQIENVSGEKPAPVRRRKQQRTVDTRLKIIKAALSEFALRSFDGATTRGISDAAQVPHSLVLYHFRNKEQLWYETVREVVSWYTRRGVGSSRSRSSKDAAARLRRDFDYYIRFCAENPDFFRLLTHENTQASDRLTWFVTHHVGPTVGRTTRLIAQAQAEGRFVEGDALTLLYLFLGAATSPYRSAREIELLTGTRPDVEAAINAHIATCERLFFRTPAPAAAPATA
ncbi:TetR/AcrR family transcriptional regulator [Caulobacter sp. UNC279MFTsu5.1]|uniref:TetR/AcrR family transcriptional regulator n=1 Tax=Caulobacter sp. UNC279MFTsu5.1 TaxID=1502775 RepID=UPI00035F750F|nr:TetR/AcrR family transcriptional regulator [Caulobacter sp. UNC279MFTsu5.1]SFI56884.1 transcriptional regulator, TetR family [Caulobacter sp. UNC279MFTsu5.1]